MSLSRMFETAPQGKEIKVSKNYEYVVFAIFFFFYVSFRMTKAKLVVEKTLIVE